MITYNSKIYKLFIRFSKEYGLYDNIRKYFSSNIIKSVINRYIDSPKCILSSLSAYTKHDDNIECYIFKLMLCDIELNTAFSKLVTHYLKKTFYNIFLEEALKNNYHKLIIDFYVEFITCKLSSGYNIFYINDKLLDININGAIRKRLIEFLTK